MDFREINQKLVQLDDGEFESYKQVALDYVESVGLVDIAILESGDIKRLRYQKMIGNSLKAAETGEELSYGIIETYQNQANLETMAEVRADMHDSVEFEQRVEGTLGAAYEDWIE